MSRSLTQSCSERHSEGEGATPVRIVEATSEGMWRVRSPGSQRASAVLGTRGEAVARAEEILRKCGGGELHVHDTSVEPLTFAVAAGIAVPGRRQITRQPRG